MDLEPLKPFDPLLVHKCFFGTEGGGILTDAVFGAVEGSSRSAAGALICFWMGFGIRIRR
jgi:hypothetical protein